jgi:predicted transcriptional regulator
MKKTNYRQQVINLMDKADINPPELIRLSGLAIGTIYGFLEGKTNIRIDSLEKIMNALKAVIIERKKSV